MKNDNSQSEQRENDPQILASTDNINKVNLSKRSFLRVVAASTAVGILSGCGDSGSESVPTVPPSAPTSTPPPDLSSTDPLTPGGSIATVNVPVAQLRAMPDTSAPVVSTATQGAEFYVIGRNEDSSWLRLRSRTFVRSEKAKLQKDISDKSDEVAVLSEGTELIVVAESPGQAWLQVRTAEGKEGYVFSGHLDGHTVWGQTDDYKVERVSETDVSRTIITRSSGLSDVTVTNVNPAPVATLRSEEIQTYITINKSTSSSSSSRSGSSSGSGYSGGRTSSYWYPN